MDRPPIEEALGVELDFVRLGTLAPEAGTLLRNLSVVEPDEGWRRDLLAAALDWDILFEGITAEVNPAQTSVGLAQDIGDAQPGLEEPPADDDPARHAISQLAYESTDALRQLAVGKLPSPVRMLRDGIERRRAIARSYPNSPLAHSDLGGFLGMAGKNLRRRDLIDEGLTECMIASELLPGWDLPAVEQGIILANFGELEEALKRLDHVRETLPEETPHFCSAKGYVLMELCRYAEAMEYLERVLVVRPDYAEASLHAAHCAFMLGDHWADQRHATTVRRLGKPGACIAWKKGMYSANKRR